MGVSHEATLRQYRLLSLAACASEFTRRTWWSSATAWSDTGSSRRCVPATPTASWRITVLAEEADAAYDRVGLTGYTEHWDRVRLALPGNDYAGDDLVELRLGGRVAEIDRAAKAVVTADGERVDYDALVLATGSYAFVPPVPGRDLPSCHVYRTLDDLDAIRDDARTRAARRPGAGRRGDRRRAARPGGRQRAALVRPARARRRDGAAADGPAAGRGRRCAARAG